MHDRKNILWQSNYNATLHSIVRDAVERWWPKQGSDDDPRTLLPPLPLGFVKVGNFHISVTRPFLVQFDFFTPFLEMSERAGQS